MNVGDRVSALDDIATYNPKTYKLEQDGIPRGALGIVTTIDTNQAVIQVKFDNGKVGLFGLPGSGLPFTTDLLAPEASGTI